jgi:hypothetical protein
VWGGSSLLGVAPSALNLLEDVELVHTDPCQCVFSIRPGSRRAVYHREAEFSQQTSSRIGTVLEGTDP